MDGPLRICGDAQARVAMNALRWSVACILGCLLLGAALLPPQVDDDPFYRWRPEWTVQERGLQARAAAARLHSLKLWTAYRSARTDEIARREFGSASAHKPASASVSVWYDTDVPQAVRLEVSRRVAAEDSARGSWRGKGRVGVLVLTDTATRVDGVAMPWGFNSGLTVSTSVLPVGPETGGRCVAVVRVGHLLLSGATALPADRNLLDACAFYDAFGTPGPQVAAWLAAERFSYARALSFAPPDSAELKASRWEWQYEDFVFTGENFTRCAADDAASCLAALHAPATDYRWFYWPDASVPEPAGAQEITQPARGFRNGLLEAMVRDIGPDRFQRVWQSPRALDEAYLDATGEPLAAWVHRRVVAISGPYHIGPLPTPTSAILTLVALTILAALTLRFARRPSAA
ncbi:MAG: hypothetical protein ACREN6_17465 [Gemmatimonadaceae bacterium]